MEPFYSQAIPYAFNMYAKLSQNPAKVLTRNYHSAMEFIYVHKGMGTVTLEKQIYPLTPGTLLYYPPFQQHHWQPEASADTPFIHSSIRMDPYITAPYLRPFREIDQWFTHLWKNKPTHPLIRVPRDKEGMLEHFFQLCSIDPLRPDRGFAGEERAAVRIAHFLQLIAPLWEGKSRRKAAPRKIGYCETILRWIEDNYASGAKLEDLYRDLHLSKHYTSHLFRKEMGDSIQSYITSRRVRQACWLLTATDRSVEQISGDLGMVNASYFCRFFKKATGIPPVQYRKQKTTATRRSDDTGFAVRTYGNTTSLS